MANRAAAELVYIASDSSPMAVAVVVKVSLRLALVWHSLTPDCRGSKPARRCSSKAQYDVSPDGQRFLVKRGADGAFARELHVVLNGLEN